MTVSVLTQADLDPLLARIAALEARPAGSASGFDFRLVESGPEVDFQIPVLPYYQIGRTESWRAPVDMPTALLYCRVRCRSTAAQAGDYCTIMQNGYGEMNAAIFSRGRAP